LWGKLKYTAGVILEREWRGANIMIYCGFYKRLR